MRNVLTQIVAAVGNRIRSTVAVLAALLVCVLPASAVELIPDVGVDVPALFSAGFLKLGVIIAIAIGAWFAIWAIKKGLNWVRGVG